MIDFFGNENLPLPRMERPYGRGLRIVADVTEVNEKKEGRRKERKNKRDGIRKHLQCVNGAHRRSVLSKKQYDFTIANKS